MQARKPAELDTAFGALHKGRADAVLVTTDAFIRANRKRVIDLAVRYHLPAMCDVRDLVEAGCLMSYGADVLGLWRRAATYVLKTAKALGLTIPQLLLIRADQVIQ